jgi:hypothetical protein
MSEMRGTFSRVEVDFDPDVLAHRKLDGLYARLGAVFLHADHSAPGKFDVRNPAFFVHRCSVGASQHRPSGIRRSRSNITGMDLVDDDEHLAVWTKFIDHVLGDVAEDQMSWSTNDPCWPLHEGSVTREHCFQHGIRRENLFKRWIQYFHQLCRHRCLRSDGTERQETQR